MVHTADRIPGAGRSRGKLHAALRIDQEIAGDHNLLAGCQTTRDHDAVAQPRARLYLARFEETVAPVDKHSLTHSGIQYGARRHQYGGTHLGLELDVHEHVGAKRVVGVRHLQPDLERARVGVELRQHAAHVRWEGAAQVAYRGAAGGAQELRVVLENVGHYPDGSQIRDAVELEALIEALAGGNIARQNDACDR